MMINKDKFCMGETCIIFKMEIPREMQGDVLSKQLNSYSKRKKYHDEKKQQHQHII